MKKKFILIIVMFICIFMTGCNADYEVEIKNDLSVNEIITVTTPASEIKKYTDYESYSEILYGMYENSDYFLNDNSSFKEISNNGNVGGTITTSYESIDKYIENSSAIKEVFTSSKVDISNQVIYFTIKDYIPLSSATSTRNPIDELNITIKSPYKIEGLKNSKCKISKGIYICNVKLTKNSEIDNFNFLINKSTNATKSIFIYIISGIIILILFGSYVYFKVLKSNKI